MKKSSILQALRLTGLGLLLTACSGGTPKLTQFTAINDRYETVYQTKNKSDLTTISQLFYDRYESNEIAANFQYLLDITTTENTERWRCSANGYCQKRVTDEQANLKIYRLERYRELYEKINLNVEN